MNRPTKRPETKPAPKPQRPSGEQTMTPSLYAAIQAAIRRLLAVS